MSLTSSPTLFSCFGSPSSLTQKTWTNFSSFSPCQSSSPLSLSPLSYTIFDIRICVTFSKFFCLLISVLMLVPFWGDRLLFLPPRCTWQTSLWSSIPSKEPFLTYYLQPRAPQNYVLLPAQNSTKEPITYLCTTCWCVSDLPWPGSTLSLAAFQFILVAQPSVLCAKWIRPSVNWDRPLAEQPHIFFSGLHWNLLQCLLELKPL